MLTWWQSILGQIAVVIFHLDLSDFSSSHCCRLVATLRIHWTDWEVNRCLFGDIFRVHCVFANFANLNHQSLHLIMSCVQFVLQEVTRPQPKTPTHPSTPTVQPKALGAFIFPCVEMWWMVTDGDRWWHMILCMILRQQMPYLSVLTLWMTVG